jgi:nucleotide-binding universal stress UspA family protein
MAETAQPRVFLVVVDESEELKIAVHYAARRAAHTGGRVALLYVIEPSELQHWRAIEDLAREERREEAEQVMHQLCEEILPIAGSMPIVYIREGVRWQPGLALKDRGR